MVRAFGGLAVLALLGCGQSPDRATEPGQAAPAASPPVVTAKSETREFRDWWAVCDNANACWAFGFAPDFDAGWVRIAMQPGPDAQPGIAFGMWGEDFFKGRQTGGEAPSISLVVDGRRFAGSVAAAADEDAPAGVIQRDSRAVVSAIANGTSMEIDAGETVSISTQGASAALLWIDERQGRIGTTTALLRRGDRPASSVPAGAPLPVIRAAEAADQTGYGDDKQTLPASLAALPQVRACMEESAHSDWLTTNVMSARLDARTELWAVPCGMGAYNVSHQWYVTGLGGRDPRPAELLGSEGPRTGEQAEVWPDNGTINGGYDPQTNVIQAFSKGRGIGDCGAFQSWKWTGRRFELSEESLMSHCAGVPPEHWPTTWRSR